MNYLPLMTDDEVKYICSIIPQSDAIIYFKKYPKDFAKIRPGFRANSIAKLNISNLLFSNRNSGFISFFIETRISYWINEIKGCFEKCLDEGDSKDLALIHTLPLSFFAGNVGLYFKLTNEEYTDEYINLLGTAVFVIKGASKEREKVKEELKAKELEISKLQNELNSAKTQLQKTDTKLNERLVELNSFRHIISELEIKILRDGTVIDSYEKKIKDQDKTNKELREKLAEVKKNIQRLTSIESLVKSRDDTIEELKVSLANTIFSNQQLEEKLRLELERQQAAIVNEQEFALMPKRPRDINEFKDCIGYNFANIGVPQNTEYYHLLKEYLGSILFQGIPIVVNRGVGANLIKCIANTLVGKSNVKTLAFHEDISINEVEEFLSSAERIVCLDNFICNFDEINLLPLFDHHRNKIIFLTTAYERTLYYISYEFFRYCHYININRITAFSANVALTEDPSTIVEEIVEPYRLAPIERYSLYLREILRELNFDQSLAERRCSAIFSELDLCCSLAFDILPYCTDVMRIEPLQTSERLLKYAGDNGKCPNKKLLKEWFRR